jgi:hypothetical protein
MNGVICVCRVEAAIRSGKLQQLASELRQELAALSSRDCSSHNLLQLKKQGLIIDLMHACDVVEGLLGSGSGSGSGIGGAAHAGGSEGVPRSPEDWAWAKQLRYYAAQVGFQPGMQHLPTSRCVCQQCSMYSCIGRLAQHRLYESGPCPCCLSDACC